MLWWPMLRSLFLSSTSVVLLAACPGDDDGGDTCGPGSAPAAGLTLTVEGETVTYGAFTASVNNDCTIGSSGVISVSVHGTQTGQAAPFTLCLPRPDLLGADPVALVPSRVPPMETDRAMLIDASAMLAGGCTVQKDATMSPTGTASFLGYCEAGAHADGYALAVTGTVPLVRTCGAEVTNVTGQLGGTVAVVPD